MENPKIKNINYPSNNKEPVSLTQYSIINETEIEHRYMILKLKNNKNTILDSLEIEITEFNKDKQAIRKNTYNFNSLEAIPKKEFVPFYKIKIDDQTNSIQYKTLNSTFQEENIENNEPKKIDEEKNIDNNGKNSTKLKNIKIKKRFNPIFIPVLLSIIFVFIVTFNINAYYSNFSEVSPLFDIIENDNSIVITGYNGDSRQVTIPEYYQGKKVIEIGENAFRDADITSIEIEGKMIKIGQGAFADTSSLTSVEGTSLSIIEPYAFENAINLSNFNFEYVQKIKVRAFDNTPNLLMLDIENIDNTMFVHGALDGSGLTDLVIYDELVILNHMLISVEPQTENLTLINDHEFNSISKYAFRESGSTLNHLEINIDNIYLEKDIFYFTRNLDTLILGDNVYGEANLFIYLTGNLMDLEMPVIGSSFSELFHNQDLIIYNLVIKGSRPMTNSYIDFESDMLRDIYIMSSVPIEQ